MNLADPELEYIDPTPNVHSLFITFDSVFFSTKLAGKAVVRWSKRMYSCAGVCSYEGRGGICDIALSEPLLKLRPRKDLVQTLLHEMIHAFLFVIGKDQDRDGHGPNFLAHMNRINQAARLNISVYHDFHDEVRLYQNHVWRCNGPCQKIRPYFGIVRRTMNKAPGPADCWWNRHRRACGGTFVKCQEPEKPEKPVKPVKATKKVIKPNADITKYINNNSSIIQNKTNTQAKTDSIVIKTGGRNPTDSAGVLETVRNVWANKTIPNTATASQTPKLISKRKSVIPLTDSITPPKKIMKIDDYFKTTASSILKDVYGKDFTVTQSNNTNKLKAVVINENVVMCPICNAKISEKIINAHIDECLNKGLIENMIKQSTVIMEPSTNKVNTINKRRDTIADLPFQPDFKANVNHKPPNPNHTNNMQSMGTIKSEIKVENDFPSIKSAAKSHGDFIDLTFIIPTNNKIKIEEIKDSIDVTAIKFKDEPSTSEEIKTCPQIKDSIHVTAIKFKDDPSISKDIKDSIDVTAIKFKDEPSNSKEIGQTAIKFKDEPSISKEINNCPCCGKTMNKPIEEHLEECMMFFDDNTSIPEEGSSLGDRTIVIDDSDDEFDETQTYNATGTKSPCPCCMEMVENADMNNHLDICLGLKLC